MREEGFRRGVVKPIECVKEGLELIKSDYWLLFAIWLVSGVIGSVSLLIAAGAMTCGTFYCYLRKIDGQPVSFDDLWKGMQWFLPGLIVFVVIVVPNRRLCGHIRSDRIIGGHGLAPKPGRIDRADHWSVDR
ncbi:hypothetical protein BH20ACI2_BH20ACI2_12600 [soil metagenome]